MKSVLKAVCTITGLVLIVLGVGGLFFLTQLDTFAKDAVQDALAQVFPSPVQFESIAFSPINQVMEVQGVSLASPENFKNEPAVQIERVLIEFDVTTIFEEAPVIRRIVLEGTRIYYRHEIGEGTNIGKLAKKAAENTGDPDRRTFVIKELLCENAKVSFSTNLVPKSRVPLNLATIHLEDLEDQPPMTSKRVAAVFLKSVIVETLTLKGLLKPLLHPLKKDVEELETKKAEEPTKRQQKKQERQQKKAAKKAQG